MRLWHEKLLNQLPRQQLLGQHRETAAQGARVGVRNTPQSTMSLTTPPTNSTSIIS